MKALLGRKLGMTQLFDDSGNVARVTVVEAGPCVVTQVKTAERDGYMAVQIGYGQAKKPNKAALGHATIDGKTSQKMREVRMDSELSDVEQVEGEAGVKVGTTLDVSQFSVGDSIVVTGTSKGKGFAGTVKRHNFATGPKTHGSHNYRAPGSIGSGFPQHVFRGMRMAGRMGGDQVTVKGLKIVRIDAENNILAISGAIPGPRKGLIMIKATQ